LRAVRPLLLLGKGLRASTGAISSPGSCVLKELVRLRMLFPAACPLIDCKDPCLVRGTGRASATAGGVLT
jgi:hypothetical protein